MSLEFAEYSFIAYKYIFTCNATRRAAFLMVRKFFVIGVIEKFKNLFKFLIE